LQELHAERRLGVPGFGEVDALRRVPCEFSRAEFSRAGST
jgi:hypothetical protein